MINYYINYLYAKFKGARFLTYYHELKKSQWLPENSIKEIQWEKLKHLLQFSYTNVPYYKSMFEESGLVPENIKTYSDFIKLAILTKKDIQDNPAKLLSEKHDINKLVKNASGGSTGVPTIFYQDLKRNDLRKGYVLRHDSWTGWSIGDKTALIWGADKDISDDINIKSRIQNYLISKQIWLNAFDLSVDNIIAFASKLKKYKPALIIGYSNALYTFFKVLQEKNISIPKPKGIIATAETLYQWQKDIIENVSGSKVFNRYGSREMGLICSECNFHNGMHINAENLFIEIINDGKPVPKGQTGEVVVTDLLNYGMPLIRYNMEDLASFSEFQCDCGRGLPLIKKVQGRTSDIILTQDGRFIHGEYFTHLFYGIPEVKKFQVVQKPDKSIIVKIELKKDVEKPALDNLAENIRNTMKTNHVSLDFVDKIIIPESGKHRFTISEVE